jgi:hypothetical protein
MSENSHITTEEAWRAWKKHCAAGLCEPAHAANLRQFGSSRYLTYIRRYASRTGHHGEVRHHAGQSSAWHLFETHTCVAQGRAGKRYKDWLFERADAQAGPWLATMESGATLLMRDVVREQLRAEAAPAFMTSLQQPVSSGEGNVCTLEHLLPDHLNPLDEIAEREWHELAIRHTDEFFATLDLPQGMTIWARASGIELIDRRLASWSKCSRAALQKIYQRVMHDLGAQLQRAYPDESPAALTRMACMVHAGIAEKFFYKYFVHRRPPRSFKTL